MSPYERAGARDGTPFRVLAVDDQDDNLMLIRRYLRTLQVDITTAANGDEALAAVAEQPPDLILLDVIMPGRSGFEVCRQLKSDPATMLIPVVLVTALDSREDRVKGIECGADDFLSKPVNREELLARSKSLLSLNQARKELEAARLAGEVRHRQTLRDAFTRYVAPALVDQILAAPDPLALLEQHARRHAVVLFADIRGFTRIAESLQPGAVVALLNEFFALLTEIAYAHRGTIFNMAGDCLMVGFGVPIETPGASASAYRAGCTMLAEFQHIARRWKQDFGIDAGLGVGMHAGEVVVGNVGSPSYMNFTIIGDTVNTASRLTDCARPGEILMSGALVSELRALGVALEIQTLAPMFVKGKAEPIDVFSARISG
ncbi:MAG: response regulator [Rhodocyclaceae bacterium]|nr:response regulator [Rhodocyclaceae bacterium]MBX3666896.1 response regulator [Rhodocyclaceae bacterium]